MDRKTCSSCHTEIPAGQAVIRSINFVQVAWHRECTDHFIPAQRASVEQAVSVR